MPMDCCEYRTPHVVQMTAKHTVIFCYFQMGAIATCQTNVACLLELVEAMQSGTNVDVAGSKIQQITGSLLITVVCLYNAFCATFVLDTVLVDGHL